VVVEDYIIHSGFDCTVSDISTERPGDYVPASVGHNDMIVWRSESGECECVSKPGGRGLPRATRENSGAV
jgi:hypothetical protein